MRALEENGEGDENADKEENEDCHSGSSDEGNDGYDVYASLASQSSTAVTFAALNAGGLSLVLSLYGSLAIVGFTSVRGQYIAPCLGGGRSASSIRIHLGIFLGMLVFFSNVCLLCAVILGDFRVSLVQGSI